MKARHPGTEEEYIRLLQLLLQSGADVAAKRFDGDTPFARAIVNGQEGVVKVLVQSKKVNLI